MAIELNEELTDTKRTIDTATKQKKRLAEAGVSAAEDRAAAAREDTVRRLAIAWALLGLAGCGKELGRIPFAEPGMGETTVVLAAGDVALWSDLDVEYQGSGQLDYQVSLEQNRRPVAQARCSAFGSMSVKISWVETNLGDSHSRRGRGKMGCTVHLDAAGPTTVKARLNYAPQPRQVTLRRADLVIKQ